METPVNPDQKLELDVHIAVLPTTRKAWVKQSIESVHAAARLSPFKVNLHIVDGVYGHLGRMRSLGYAMGDAPYKTFVDDDDYLTPEAFHAVAEALATWPDAVFPGEYSCHKEVQRAILKRHHLPIYRRELIIDHDAWVIGGDIAQLKSVEHLNVIDVAEPVYVYRVYHNSASRKLRYDHREEIIRASKAYP
jgi:hypothetical protein